MVSIPTPSNSSTPSPSPKPCRIFTIPPDLPLADDERCRRDIDHLNLSTPLTHSNLSPTEHAALRSLCSNPNLTIKPTDNGAAVV
eukprot:g28758.t1